MRRRPHKLGVGYCTILYLYVWVYVRQLWDIVVVPERLDLCALYECVIQ